MYPCLNASPAEHSDAPAASRVWIVETVTALVNRVAYRRVRRITRQRLPVNRDRGMPETEDAPHLRRGLRP